MSEFLDAADGLRRSRGAGPQLHDFDLLLEARSYLQDAVGRFEIDVNNIESVFAAFEMAAIAGRLGKMDPDKVGALPAAMKRLIYRTLELTIPFPWKEQSWHPPAPYESFVEMINRIAPDRPWERCSIITLNYDLCLDYALNWHSVEVEYCLGRQPAPGAFRLMKLHGSLNWARCPKCGEVFPWRLPDYLRLFPCGPEAGRPRYLEVASKMRSYTHRCGEHVEPDPFIVPPTWNKTMHRSQLENVWQAAANELAQAEEVIVIGYSLPETDYFFRYLLAVGTAGRTLIDKFWVYDPDPAVGDRFGRMLGAATRPRFRHKRITFGQAVEGLKIELEPPHGMP